MKNLVCFLLGFTIVFMFGLAFAENKCQEALKICQESCIERGGMLVFTCYGPNVAIDEKIKCRCISW